MSDISAWQHLRSSIGPLLGVFGVVLQRLLCGRPVGVASELSTRQLDRSGSWQVQLQTSAEDALIYTVLKHLAYRPRDVSGRYALQIDLLTYL